MAEDADVEKKAGATAVDPGSAVDAALKLEFRSVHVTYHTEKGEKIPAAKDISFTIEDKPGTGEVVVFLGPSGCGKSTILKCAAGLLTPTKGEVYAQGRRIESTGRDRGMVFQQYTSFAWLTVQDNVEYGLKLAGVPKKEREARASKVLGQVGLSKFKNTYPKELSGGMKQRVAIARTLVNDPKLVLMDEPFGALDPQTRWGMQTLLLRISHQADNTILFVTHDVAEAVYLADTIYVLSHRPATILHKKVLPNFRAQVGEGEDAPPSREIKQSKQFRDIEAEILDLLHEQEGELVLG